MSDHETQSPSMRFLPADGIDFYSVMVGNLEVTLDFKASAVSVTRTDAMVDEVVTEELGNGFLIDRAALARDVVVSVEVIS